MTILEQEQRRRAAEDFQKWKELIESMSYKPNWKIEFIGEPDNRVKFTMHVEDSRFTPPPGAKTPVIPVWAQFGMGPYINRNYAVQSIKDIIKHLELHELDEWLKVDGELWFDPHADAAAKA